MSRSAKLSTKPRMFRNRYQALFYAANISSNPKTMASLVRNSENTSGDVVWMVQRGVDDSERVSAIFYDDRIVWSEFPERDRPQNVFGEVCLTADDAIKEIVEALSA